MINVLSMMLGPYILLEAIKAMADMDGGDRVCRVAKYVLSATSGLMLAWYGWRGSVDWLHVSLAASLALFAWPKMVSRVRHIFKFDRRSRLDRRA